MMSYLLIPLPYVGSVQSLLIAIAVTIVSYLALYLARLLLTRQFRGAASTETLIDDFILELVARVRLPIRFWISFLLGAFCLPLPDPGPAVLHKLMVLGIAIQFFMWTDVCVKMLTRSALGLLPSSSAGRYISAVQMSLKIGIWLLLCVATLDNLGISVGSLITGLGVGGVAVALASQRVIGDLISTLTIALDRPFAEGDVIKVGDHTGKVRSIGLKTTRLQLSGGEELIVPNADLVNLRITNQAGCKERWVSINLHASWRTPADTLAALPERLKACVDAEPQLRFERALLSNTTELGYIFELCWWVTVLDEDVHLQSRQRVLLAVAHLWQEKAIQPIQNANLLQ